MALQPSGYNRVWGTAGGSGERREGGGMKSGDRCLPVSREWLASALPKRKREHAVPDYAQHTIPRSNPMRIQGAPWPLPPHACRLLDSIQMDSKVKLQSQVKSNSRLGGRGPGAQLPHLPRQRNAQTLCTPTGAPLTRRTWACRLEKHTPVPGRHSRGLPWPWQHSLHSSWRES